MLATLPMGEVKKDLEFIMVVLNRIYTRTGDDGHHGARQRASVGPKYDLRVRGLWNRRRDQRRASAWLRLHHVRDAPELDSQLLGPDPEQICFDLGADLAVPQRRRTRRNGLRMLSSQVERLERDIDTLNARALCDLTLVRAARAGRRLRPICMSPAPYVAGRNG